MCGTARPNWNRLSLLDVALNFLKDLVKRTFRRDAFRNRLRTRCCGIWISRSRFLLGSDLPNQPADFVRERVSIVVRMSHHMFFCLGEERLN